MAANILELVRKIKLEKMMVSEKLFWFAEAVEKLYQTTRLTLGMTAKILCDLRRGGEELILALKSLSHLNKAKYYLYYAVNFAGV